LVSLLKNDTAIITSIKKNEKGIIFTILLFLAIKIIGFNNS